MRMRRPDANPAILQEGFEPTTLGVFRMPSAFPPLLSLTELLQSAGDSTGYGTRLACLLSTPLRAAIVALLLSGCAHAPDPQAPVVMREAQTVEIPVPVVREPPVELMQPLGLQAPGLLPAGQGDYCMTRADVEQTIDVLRAAASRLNQWRAWAAPGDVK